MVTKNYEIKFKFDEKTYAKYLQWCKDNKLDGYHGAIGGSHHFEIAPTSIGNFIEVVAKRAILDEKGEFSYDNKGKLKTEEIRLTLFEP